MRKILAGIFLIAFFLGGAAFAQENAVPDLGDLIGIFQSDGVVVAKSVDKDGTAWTIVIIRGHEAKKLAEEWESKNMMVLPEEHLIIFLDLRVEV